MAHRFFKNHAGRRFGELTAIAKQPGRFSNGNARWLCRCSCGREIMVRSDNLVLRRKTHCGCKRRLSELHLDPLGYGSWSSMIERCENPKHHKYRLYGAQGIRVCERWRTSFKAFLEDMGPRPSRAHSIERLNGNGDYEPSDCCWATAVEQNRNRRNTVFVEYGGERMKLVDLCEMLDLNRGIVYGRLKNGWPIEEAIRPGRRRYQKAA